MNMSAFVDLAGTGATWVLYLLIGLSAIQLALIIERAIAFVRSRAAASQRTRIRDALASGSMRAVALAVSGDRSLEARVIAAGAATADRGVDAVDEIMHSALVEEKLQLERGLAFLGTLGNNAPFLGLFGTVLGIIHAMADMSTAAGGQASRAVLSGISEALISTAVGLIVALPAVAAFNYFQRTLKTRSVSAEALGGELMAQLKSPAIARHTGHTGKAA
ncbi:MAG TPA: MotA/TolQ/ExbB proton channel family protein [Kofleriaceae bacterium]|nr:MotA/TolQ/ExbB proton channel family protein [Kofleriaceae bacterium]